MPDARCTVSKFADSIVRHPVAISGAILFTSRNVRQSNDWMVARCAKSRGADGLDDQHGEWFGLQGLVRLVRSELGLDVEADLVAGTQRQHRGEGRDALAIDGLLNGKLLGVRAARIEPADVVGRQLRQCQRTDRRAWPCQPRAVRTADQGRVEIRVVRDHRHTVPGDGDVDFERVHADREGALECGDGVFRREAACTAVALHVEGHRDSGKQRKQRARPGLHAREFALPSNTFCCRRGVVRACRLRPL